MHEQAIVGELTREEATEERIAFLSAGGGRRVRCSRLIPRPSSRRSSRRRRRRGPSEHIVRLHGHTVRFKEATLQYVGVLTVLLILIAIFSYLAAAVPHLDNFLNILETNATLLILSVGLTFVLLVGGFDLSIGGVLALSGVFVAKLLEQRRRHLRLDDRIVILGGIAVGIVFNGFPIAKLGANFFMITLGVSFATRGIALVMTNGASIGLYNVHDAPDHRQRRRRPVRLPDLHLDRHPHPRRRS